MKFNTSIIVSVGIVSAFVAKNSVPVGALSGLIEAVHTAVKGLAAGAAQPPTLGALPIPAVPIGKSVTRDYLICLEDGKRFKSLRRHLTKLGMTPEQYRKKWGLPSDYSLVAASYSERRTQLAKKNGLGHSNKGKPASPQLSGVS